MLKIALFQSRTSAGSALFAASLQVFGAYGAACEDLSLILSKRSLNLSSGPITLLPNLRHDLPHRTGDLAPIPQFFGSPGVGEKTFSLSFSLVNANA